LLKLYHLATAIASPLAPAILRARAKAGKEDLARMGERLGRPSAARPGGRLVWLHGVSVGESLSLLPIVERLHDEQPDLAVLVTSGTRASADILAMRLGERSIHQYAPLDTAGAVAKFLDYWRPGTGIFVESDLWPNLIFAAKARNVRLALASARLSERSFARWRRAPLAAHAILAAFDLLLARDRAAAERFAAFGVTVHGLADFKFGAAPLPVDAAELTRLRADFGSRPIILAASTHPGDLDQILKGFIAATRDTGTNPLLIIAPRHPDRGPEMARSAVLRGLRAGLRSAKSNPSELDIYVADTLGELGLWYRLARLAILGGSFSEGSGGHNPLESARLGCPFITGPYVRNWPIYGEMEALSATSRVWHADGLAQHIRNALSGDAETALMAERALAFVESRDSEALSGASRVLALIAG
jgi:3-deoxy-D-manno-octulosonic-acid transferase